MRLRSRKEFERVYRSGRAWSSRLLVFRVLPNDLGHPRYGLAVGRTVGTAVVRNRVRRRLRELLRRLPPNQGLDVVVTARRVAAEASFHDLRVATEQLARRSGLLVEPGSYSAS